MRAIQFSNKRVGSTFLQQAINSHPDMVGIDEVFVNIARKASIRKSGFVPYINSDITNPGEYIEDVIHKTYPDKHTIFKLMYNQMTWHESLRAYIRETQMPIIHLKRRNLVKQVLSFLKMGEYNHDPIVITPQELFKQVEQAENLDKVHSQAMHGQIALTLYYEDLIGEKGFETTYMANNANVAICQLFGVTLYMLNADTKKKLRNDISEYLPNIDEIRKFFKGSKYQWMI